MLNEEQINKIKQVMATSGWNEIVMPATVNRGKAALNALTLSPSEREAAGGEFKDTDDATLRAIIKNAEWMTACWRNEVNVFEYNRRNEELVRQQNGVEAPA